MIVQYVPERNSDLVVASWWAQLAHDDELKLLFGNQDLSLSQFYALFQPPNILYYEVDEEGVLIAGWFEPFMAGAFVSVYVAPRARKSIASLNKLDKIMAVGLDTWGVLAGVTWQPKVLKLAETLGFIFTGTPVPGMFYGQTAYFYVMTPESYALRKRGDRWVK